MLPFTSAPSRVAALIAMSLATGCVIESSDDASLTVVNESDYVIVELYLTEIDNPNYGPNLLGGDVLYPGEDLRIGVSCDYYDALLIDEDGVSCELFDLDLCLNDAAWVIRNNTCSVFGARGKDDAASTQAPEQAKL